MRKNIFAIVPVLVLVFAFAAVAVAEIYGEYGISFTNASTYSKYDTKYYFVNQNPDPAEPGGYVEMRWKIENFGTSEVKSLLVEIVPDYPFSLDSGAEKIQKVGSVWGRQIGSQGVIVYYKLRIDENAVEGTNYIGIRFSTDGGITWTQPQKFAVRIQTHDAILTVEEVSSEPAIISPGEKAKVRIRLKNMADSMLEDIKVKLSLLQTVATTTTVTTIEKPFTPLTSTDEKTLQRLGSKESATVEFELIADGNAESKIYKIPLAITYSDELGKNYSKSNIIGLVVGGKPELSIMLESSDIYKSGTVGTVTIKFVNKGVTDIKFLDAKLKEGSNYKILSGDEVYVGNIDSDDYETAEFRIFVNANAKSDVKLSLAVEYRDANNNRYQKDADVALRLYTTKEAKNYGIAKGNNKVGIIIVIVIVVAGFWIYRKHRRRKNK